MEKILFNDGDVAKMLFVKMTAKLLQKNLEIVYQKLF